IVDKARDMATWLGNITGLHAAFELFPDETHMSVLPAAINRAIRFALGPEAHRAAEQRRR
uniref:hypothetical protein n=1 Tax=Stenotrophomonas maltophilia TaxID=40324 RepID=UPI003CCFF14B